MGPRCDGAFLIIPESGAVRLIDGHPLADRVSDLIEAVPASIDGPNRACSLWVRETAVSEGRGRNVLAATVFRLLASGPVQPVFGPAVLTATYWHFAPTSGNVVATAATCLARPVAERIVTLCRAVSEVLASKDSGLDATVGDVPGFVSAVRKIAAEAEAVPVPENWPYMNDVEPDGVASIMRKLGLGRTFAPVPLKVEG